MIWQALLPLWNAACARLERTRLAQVECGLEGVASVLPSLYVCMYSVLLLTCICIPKYSHCHVRGVDLYFFTFSRFLGLIRIDGCCLTKDGSALIEIYHLYSFLNLCGGGWTEKRHAVNCLQGMANSLRTVLTVRVVT